VKPLPTRRSLRRMCLALVFAASPVGVLAQTQPIPRIPPPVEAPPSGQGAAPVPEGPGLARAWDYSLGVGPGWESDVGLRLADGRSDFAGVFNGALSRTIKNPLGEVHFSAHGFGYLYSEQTLYSNLNGYLDFEGRRRLSQRTTGTLDLSFGAAESQNTSILIDQGTLLPPTRTISYSGTAAVAFQATERTVLRGSAEANRVDFPDSPLLQTSNSLRMSADLDRRLGMRDTVSFEYSAQLANSLQQASASPSAAAWWTHYGSSQWVRQVSPRMSFLLEAGASYTPNGLEAGLQSQWQFFGGASLSRQVGRSSLTAYYRREVIPVFGVGGLRLADRVGVNASVPLGQRWSTSLDGTYAGAAKQGPEEGRQSATDVYASVAARLSRRFWLSTRGNYLRRSPTGDFAALNDFRVAILLVLTSPGSTPAAVPWR
jgi:hypothetical protein